MILARCSSSFPAHLASETYEYWDGRRICVRHLRGLIGPQLTLADGFAMPGWCRYGKHEAVQVWRFDDETGICAIHLREWIRIATWPRPPETLV